MFSTNKVTTIRVDADDEYGVTGYYAEKLVGVRNPGSRRIRFVLGISPDDGEQSIDLGPGETFPVSIDIDACIRRKFMPYVKTTKDLSVDIIWESNCDAPPQVVVDTA